MIIFVVKLLTILKNIFHSVLVNLKEQKILSIFIVSLFFFNNFMMPHGLSLALILSPFFFYLSFKNKEINASYLYVFSLFFFYLTIHSFFGVENYINYFKTSILILSALLFLEVSYYYLKKIDLNYIFKLLNILNFFFFLMSLILLKFEGINERLWSFKPISNGIDSLPRLQIFTPEPSHYALLIIPLVFYFFLKLILNKFSKENLLFFTLIIIPFFAGLSFGAILVLIITIILLSLFYPKSIFYSKRNIRFTLISLISLIIIGFAIHKIKPNNSISKRVSMIISGEDTSANGRTTQSFGLAKDVAKDKSYLFGAGPGQSKIIAKKYYFKNLPYRSAMPEVIRYSNVSATTLASYGISGLMIRVIILLIFFFKLKVYENIYGTSIFVFMFIFQFMASYMINISELSIWVIAFLSVSKKEFNWANA